MYLNIAHGTYHVMSHMRNEIQHVSVSAGGLGAKSSNISKTDRDRLSWSWSSRV